MRTSAPAPRVLQTRLARPRRPEAALERPALVERLRTALSGRLTRVVAAAGYGKTVALSTTLETLGTPWMWLRCDERLADDPSLLMAHLACGLGACLSGRKLRVSSAESPEDQVGELCDELHGARPTDVVIVLDRVDALAPGASATLPGLLARDLPAGFHLAIASRVGPTPPPGGPYMDGAMEMGEADLALDRDEAAALLRASARSGGDDAAHALAVETEGWITGLLLGSRSEPTHDAAEIAWGPVSTYLKQEVVARQPRDAQDFMHRTAVLEHMTPALADAVTERGDAGRMLAALHADHAFVFGDDAGPPALRYHRLLRRLLLERVHEAGPRSLAALHRRAALGWQAAGEPIRAVSHHFDAGDHAGVAQTLGPIALRVATSGHAEALREWLGRLPAPLVDANAALVLAQAVLTIGRGADRAAVEALAVALERLQRSGDGECAAAAAFWLLRAIRLADGELERGIAVGTDVVSRPGEPHALAAARVALAALYGRTGRFEDAEAELVAALAAGPDDRGLLGAYASATQAFVVDHPQARSEGALEMVEGAIARLDREERDDALAFLPEARAYRAEILSQLGYHEEALAEAGRLSSVAERRGLGPALGSVVTRVRIDALAGLDRWRELAEEVERASAPPAGIRGAGLAAHLRAIEARLAVRRGEPASAGRHARAAAEAIPRDGAPFSRALLLSDVAVAAAEAGEGHLADRLAADAHETALAAAAPWARARAAMIRAALAQSGPEGRAHLEEALELTARWRLLTLWTRREPDLALRLLPMAVAEQLGPDGVAARLVGACGGRVKARCADGWRDGAAEPSWRFPVGPSRAVESRAPDGSSHLAPSAPAPLRPAFRHTPIRLLTLGQFSVWRGGAALAPAQFHRQKARALLAVLASAAGPVSRERLIEWLWPHLPPARAVAALHSTVHTLRHALEPSLPRGARSSRVAFSGNAYRLALGDEDEWDAAAFLGLARRALEAHGAGNSLDLLRAADAAYGGPYLPEWGDVEWVAARREEIALTHRAVLEALGATLLGTRRLREAIDAYRRLVALEPDHEVAHRSLMAAYLRAGERGLALRQYRECLQRMQALGVSPSPETETVHDSVLSGAPAGAGGAG